MPGGNVGSGVCVDLSHGFRRLDEVDARRRQVRAGCGVVATDVARAAESAGLFFPPLPSSADRCTLGGMVANNAAGARSFKYGAVREWVREVDVVLADGRCVRLARGGESSGGQLPAGLPGVREAPGATWDALSHRWPRVAKNASGYALDRFLRSGEAVELFVGSEGTLGFITAVTLALLPAPADRRLILLGIDSADALPPAVDAARATGASACEFLGRAFIELANLEREPTIGEVAEGAFALLLIELDGEPAEAAGGIERLQSFARSARVRSLVAETREDRRKVWNLRRKASPRIAAEANRGLVSMQFIEDSVVPLPRIVDYLAGVEGILARFRTGGVIFGHAGDGHLHVNPLVDVRRPRWKEAVRGILDDVVELVAELGGTLSGEHGDGRVRAPFVDRIWSPSAVAAFRAVKSSMDPDGILNPGVILPLPGQDPLRGLPTARVLDVADR